MNKKTIELYPTQVNVLKHLLQSTSNELKEHSILRSQYETLIEILDENTPPNDPYLARLSACFMDCNINIETDVIKLGETDTFKLFSVYLKCGKSIAIMKLTEENGNIVASQDLYEPCNDRETFMVMSKLMKNTQFPTVSAIDIGVGTVNLGYKRDRYVQYLLDCFLNSYINPDTDIIKLGENDTTKLFLIYFEKGKYILVFKMTEKDGKIIATQELHESCADRETFKIMSEMLKGRDDTFTAQATPTSLKELALDFGIGIMTTKKETVYVDPYIKRLEQLYGPRITPDSSNNFIELKQINNDRLFLVFEEHNGRAALVQLSKDENAPDNINIKPCVYEVCENRKTFVNMAYIIKTEQMPKNLKQQLIANCANIDPANCKKNIYRCILEKYLKRTFPKSNLDTRTDIVDVGCNTDRHRFLVYWPDQKVTKLVELKKDNKLKKMVLSNITNDMDADRKTFFLTAEMLKALNKIQKESEQKEAIVIKSATVYDPYGQLFNTIRNITKKVKCEDGRVLLYANDFVWQIPKDYTIKECD